MRFNKADDHIRRIRELRQPSTIAVVSASPRFLEVARGVLASAIGTRHQLQEVLLPVNKSALRACNRSGFLRFHCEAQSATLAAGPLSDCRAKIPGGDCRRHEGVSDFRLII